MTRLAYNGVVAALGGSLTSSGTSVTFAAALTYNGGTSVPTIASPDYLPLTILDSSGVPAEIVYLTAYTSGGTSGTITRGQEGTSGASRASGLVVVNSATTADLPWTRLINDPLSSMSAWTAGAGTWAVSGGVTQQTATTSTVERLHYSTIIPVSTALAQCDMRLDTGTSTGHYGFSFGTPPASDGGGALFAGFRTGSATTTVQVYVEEDSVAAGNNYSITSISSGTWHTLKVMKSGASVSMWVNGVYITGFTLNINWNTHGRFALNCYGAAVSFRNLQFYTPTLPI